MVLIVCCDLFMNAAPADIRTPSTDVEIRRWQEMSLTHLLEDSWLDFGLGRTQVELLSSPCALPELESSDVGN